MLIRQSAIYNIYYTNWETNLPDNRIIFVLYTPGVGKIHCLQLSAKQLSLVNRMKLINIIAKLSKTPQAQKWNGRVLYGIFKKYAPDAIRQCYRTLWTQYIRRYALLNYGLNDPTTFLMEEKAYQDKGLYQQVRANIINQALNMYTNKGYKPNENMFAKPIIDKPVGNKKPNTIDPTKPVKNPGVKPNVANVKPTGPATTKPVPGKTTNAKPGNTNKGGNNKPGGDDNTDINY